MEQGINSSSKLFVKVKYWKTPSVNVDPTTLHLMYMQVNQKILNGEYLCSEHVIINLASYQAQILLGDRDVRKHRSGFLE